MRKMARKRRMKTRTKAWLFVIVIAIAVVLSISISFFYTNRGIEEVKIVKMDLVVKEKIAFNLDADALHFGGVFPGGGSTRGIVLNNTKDYPLKAKIYLSGKLASWVSVDINPVSLEPLGEKKVTFTANVPSGAEYGTYEGEVKIVFKKG